jgi:hypothetical protein
MTLKEGIRSLFIDTMQNYSSSKTEFMFKKGELNRLPWTQRL